MSEPNTQPAASDLPARFNVADHFLLPHQSPERRDRPYLICGEETLTFGEAHAQANRAGNALRRLGVQPEQRVVLLMRESLLFPAAFWGAVRIGAVAVPLNTVLTPHDYAYYLNDSRATALVVDAALWERIAAVAPELRHLRHVVAVNGDVPGAPRLEALLAQEPAELESEAMTPDLPAFWLYTSGSTGPPKGTVHLHRAMVWAAEHYTRRTLGLGPGDVTFSAPKFFFAYGLCNSLYGPLATGATAVIQPDAATPENCFALLARHRPAVFYAVPTLLNAMLNRYEAWQRGEGEPPADLPRLEHLRFAVSAGETLPLAVYRRWERHFGTPVLDGIGSTEMLNFYVANRPDACKPGSTGRLVSGYDARLVDEQGRDVPPGEVGELWARGDSMAAGYWNKSARSRHTFRGPWLATGDRFHRDEAGWFYYHGRTDDMMKIGGSWVSPAEVEGALLEHPAVAECAVVGRYDADGLMRSHAHVVLHPGHAPGAPLSDALLAHLRERLPAFKVPHDVAYVDGLPKTATGKIRRFLLREATGAARV